MKVSFKHIKHIQKIILELHTLLVRKDCKKPAKPLRLPVCQVCWTNAWDSCSAKRHKMEDLTFELTAQLCCKLLRGILYVGRERPTGCRCWTRASFTLLCWECCNIAIAVISPDAFTFACAFADIRILRLWFLQLQLTVGGLISEMCGHSWSLSPSPSLQLRCC